MAKITEFKKQVTSNRLLNGNGWLELDEAKTSFVSWFLDGYTSSGKSREIQWNSAAQHEPIAGELDRFYSERKNRLIPVSTALSGYILPKMNPDYSEEWLESELTIMRKLYKRVEAKSARSKDCTSDESRELQARYDAIQALLNSAPEKTLSLKNGNFWIKMNLARRYEYVETLAEGSLWVMPLWEREKNPFYKEPAGDVKLTKILNEVYSDPENRLIPLSLLLDEYAIPKMLGSRSDSELSFALSFLHSSFADAEAVKAFADGANTSEAIERVKKHFAAKRKEAAKTKKKPKARTKTNGATRKSSATKQTEKDVG